MSPETSPDNKQKTPVFQPARQAEGFRALTYMLLWATVGLTIFFTVGHALAPALIGAPTEGLLRITFLACTTWLVFNALWALINHLVATSVHGVIQGFALVMTHMLTALAAYAQAQANALAAEQDQLHAMDRAAKAAETAETTTTDGTVAYMTDFLKERLEALKNPNPSGDA